MSQQQKQPQQIPTQCQQKCGAVPKGAQQSQAQPCQAQQGQAQQGQAKAAVKSLPQQQQQEWPKQK